MRKMKTSNKKSTAGAIRKISYDYVIGVDEDGIDNLILDINDKIELCNSILNNIEDCVDNVLVKYKTNDKALMQQKFESLKSNFPILINNLESYSSDLVRVKNGFYTADEKAVDRVKISKSKFTNKEVKN